MKKAKLCKADLHVHSCRSWDVPDFDRYMPRALFEAALGHPDPGRRMDYFALTDHNTMAGFEELRRSLSAGDRRLLIPAVEHNLRDPGIGFSIHVNLYQLTPDQYAEIQERVVTLADMRDYCRARGILTQYNHPTWWEREELKNGQVTLEKVRDAAAYFDVLELNAGRTVVLNRVTANLARDMGKYLTCNSDTHSGDVGKACNEAPGDTVGDFLAAIWSGRGRPVRDNMTNRALLTMVHSVIDELFNHRHGVRIKDTAMDSGNPRIERLTQRVIGSDLVMRCALVREPLRLLLKQVARPVVYNLMAHERRLERELGESSLQCYL